MPKGTVFFAEKSFLGSCEENAGCEHQTFRRDEIHLHTTDFQPSLIPFQSRCFMSHISRKLLVPIVTGAVMAAATSAWAIADAGAKARGDFSGGGFSGSSGGYYSAPMARAPVLANQNSGERRMLSVEPSAPAASCGCCSAPTAKAVAPAPNATAKKDTTTEKKAATTAKKDTTTRSYSVDPAPAPRSYSAPSRSSTPLYLLPKSDSRKFGGG
jgi:hypothetical protein